MFMCSMCSQGSFVTYGVVRLETACMILCDVSLDLCLCLVPFAFFTLRTLVCTMHYVKRYWILKSDKGSSSDM